MRASREVRGGRWVWLRDHTLRWTRNLLGCQLARGITDRDESSGLKAGSVAQSYSVVLTSKLVRAFFKTSWVLVTGNRKQPHRCANYQLSLACLAHALPKALPWLLGVACCRPLLLYPHPYFSVPPLSAESPSVTVHLLQD